MKKMLLLILSLTLILGLTACKKENEETVFDVPEEVYVNLQTLGYAEYLNLSNPVVTINVRGMGQIKIQLFPNVAKNTVDSFIKYIEDGAYTNNEFHRVINGFVIQAGHMDEPSCTIAGEMTNNGFENNLSHFRGVLSMARFGGYYNSGNSQFFIMHQTGNSLNGEYATFGGTVSGFNIVDFIAALNDSGVNEVPRVPVYIDSITIELNEYVPAIPVCIE